MGTLISILVSVLINQIIWFIFRSWIYKKAKEDQDKLYNFVDKHPWAQPNQICYLRTILGLISLQIYICYYIFDIKILCFIGLFGFTTAMYLDSYDGMVARAARYITEWGKWLDPFCDKIKYLSALTFFSYIQTISYKLLIVLVLFELIGQTWVRYYLKSINFSVAAIGIGKVKVVVCFFLVIYSVLLNDGLSLPNYANHVLMLCIALSIGSMIGKLIPRLRRD